MSAIEVEVVIAAGYRREIIGGEDQSVLQRAAKLALERHSPAPGTQLTVKLTSNEEVRELNRTYRGTDAATDVLSFEMNQLLPDGGLYLGDVVIAVPVAQAQAQAAGHELRAELALLVIHGVLHLLGYDHAEATQKAVMWAVQSEILAALGLTARATE